MAHQKTPAPHEAPEAPPSTAPTSRTDVSRRRFLKASALGAGAIALPGCASAAAAATPDQGGTANPATGQRAIDYTTQADTWVTPWEFDQKMWPGQSVQLNAVEHAAPVALFGNLGAAQDANVSTFLFSWNGIAPAPTLRVRYNETLFVEMMNQLGPNATSLLIPNGQVPPTPLPPFNANATGTQNPFLERDSNGNFIYVVETADFCRPIHSNHKKQLHTTNIHFHGSHVSPYLNPDGTRSDDIFLRIVPQGDYQLRQTSSDPNNPALQDPVCWPLKGSEMLAQAQYQYRLGRQGGATENHPPGTFWYHPHAHGSTFSQVAGGMAGLIIVEGDVDDYLAEQLTSPATPGSFSERPFVLQRIVGPAPLDFEELPPISFMKNSQPKQKSPSVFPAVNGHSLQTVENYIVVSPGAVERWRVLNAGVDGQGYLDLMVLDLVDPGDLANTLNDDNSQTVTWAYRGPNGTSAPVTLTITIPPGGATATAPVTWTRSDGTSGQGGDILETLYAQMAEYLYTKRSGQGRMVQLATDGITLVSNEGANSKYHTRPLTRPTMIAPANRMDYLFQAPTLASGEDYKLLSIWTRQNIDGADAAFASAGAFGTKILQNIATIITRGIPTPPPATNPRTGQPFNLNALEFPPLPRYLTPISDAEVSVRPGDPDYNQATKNSGSRANNNGMRRARRVIYSGWGGGGFPVGTNADGSPANNRLNELAAFYRIPQEENYSPAGPLGGVSGPESMMIDCRKFNDDPNDLEDIAHHMLLGTAEEWTVNNFSLTLFNGDPTGPPSGIQGNPNPLPGHIGNRAYASPQEKTNVTTKAVDHPFHIHINPCWVTGLYDWAGEPLGWNYERVADGDEFYPRWHDVMRLPRMGGYVTFRSRFWDFDGEYVNHCHILQHEDNGMMQGIAVVPDASQADYVPMTAGQRFPMATWKDCYTMDWGVGGTTAQGEAERARLIALRTRLRTPV